MERDKPNPKPKVGASGGKPNFWHDCLMYGVKPWDDDAPEFWHSLNKELAKQQQHEAKRNRGSGSSSDSSDNSSSGK